MPALRFVLLGVPVEIRAGFFLLRACILTADGHVPEATDLVEQAAARRPALGWIARVDPLLRGLSSLRSHRPMGRQPTGRENRFSSA